MTVHGFLGQLKVLFTTRGCKFGEGDGSTRERLSDEKSTQGQLIGKDRVGPSQKRGENEWMVRGGRSEFIFECQKCLNA
jgi:hypothetical protein